MAAVGDVTALLPSRDSYTPQHRNKKAPQNRDCLLGRHDSVGLL